MFGLRKVNRNTHTFETTFQNWKENGEDVALLMPEFSAKWLPIAEESGSWSGWVLLGEMVSDTYNYIYRRMRGI